MKIVIAGNYRQFQEWYAFHRRLKGFENCRYISSIEKLYGLKPEGIELVLIGEYWLSPVYNSDRFTWLSKDYVVIKPL